MNRRRSIAGWLSAAGIVPLLAIVIAGLPFDSIKGQTTYTVYNAPVGTIQGSEELDLVLGGSTKFALVVGSNETSQQRVRTVPLSTTPAVLPGSFLISDGPAGAYPNLFPTTDPGGSGQPVVPVVSNIAIHPTGEYVIVTLRDATSGNATPGKAVFLNVNQSTGAVSRRDIGTADGALTLGIFPDSVEIAANGNYAVIANSDERAATDGSIQIVDLRAGGTQYQVINTITPVVPAGSLNLGTGAQPETVTINAGSTRAYVTLQPNNAVTIVDISPTTLAASATTVDAGRVGDPATGTRRHPDGIHVITLPIGGVPTDLVVTADEGVTIATPPPPVTAPYQARANSVSMFRVDAGPALTVLNSRVSVTPNAQPAKVEIGTIGGIPQAAVTLGGTSAPGKLSLFGITPTGITEATEINLVDSVAANTGQNPIGVVFGNNVTFGGQTGDVVVTANRTSRNISIVYAVGTSSPPPSVAPSTPPTPVPSTPAGPRRTFLPLAQK